MRLAWLTDIHLDFVTTSAFEALCHEVAQTGCDAVLIGGDIATSRLLDRWLLKASAIIPCPIHFVLGNHDYYHSDIATVRQRIHTLTQDHPKLRWLAAHPHAVKLDATHALIGVGGWGDGRLGDYHNSTIRLNDHLLIRDLLLSDRDALLTQLKRLGAEAATTLAAQLDDALTWAEHVLVLTHVPPFHGACWYQGAISDPYWLPHFACKATGDVLLDRLQRHPNARCTVLCGHTHHPGRYQPLPNLVVHTGRATYKAPEIQAVWALGDATWD